jgi:hypothetical protein
MDSNSPSLAVICSPGDVGSSDAGGVFIASASAMLRSGKRFRSFVETPPLMRKLDQLSQGSRAQNKPESCCENVSLLA